MSRNPKNTQDNLNNTTNLNNIRDEEGTIPEIDRKQEFADLDRLLELSKILVQILCMKTQKKKFEIKKKRLDYGCNKEK
jgi:hypothetical protein